MRLDVKGIAGAGDPDVKSFEAAKHGPYYWLFMERPHGSPDSPRGLTGERLWRWCVKRTILDLRHGRTRSPANARRLFLRRWSAAGGEASSDAAERGEAMVRAYGRWRAVPRA